MSEASSSFFWVNKLVEIEFPYTLKVDNWETPATKYPLARVGSAEISRVRYNRNYYRMEAVCGYMFFQVTKPIHVTNLKINGQVWMVDDPLHWYGMQELAKHSKGKVLVGGLGLGLIIHALQKNPKVSRIDVLEINQDVIDLVKPLLFGLNKAHVHKGNVFHCAHGEYDTVILDLWVGKGTPKVGYEMLGAFATFKARFPKANVFIWGHGSSSLNPAVDDKLRKQIPKEYY